MVESEGQFMETTNTNKKQMKKHLKRFIIFVAVIAAIAIIMTVLGNYKSNPADVNTYKTDNPYILEETDISGHRSGGGIAPEETMMAFKNCAENPASLEQFLGEIWEIGFRASPWFGSNKTLFYSHC